MTKSVHVSRRNNVSPAPSKRPSFEKSTHRSRNNGTGRPTFRNCGDQRVSQRSAGDGDLPPRARASDVRRTARVLRSTRAESPNSAAIPATAAAQDAGFCTPRASVELKQGVHSYLDRREALLRSSLPFEYLYVNVRRQSTLSPQTHSELFPGRLARDSDPHLDRSREGSGLFQGLAWRGSDSDHGDLPRGGDLSGVCSPRGSGLSLDYLTRGSDVCQGIAPRESDEARGNVARDSFLLPVSAESSDRRGARGSADMTPPADVDFAPTLLYHDVRCKSIKYEFPVQQTLDPARHRPRTRPRPQTLPTKSAYQIALEKRCPLLKRPDLLRKKEFASPLRDIEDIRLQTKVKAQQKERSERRQKLRHLRERASLDRQLTEMLTKRDVNPLYDQHDLPHLVSDFRHYLDMPRRPRSPPPSSPPPPAPEPSYPPLLFLTARGTLVKPPWARLLPRRRNPRRAPGQTAGSAQCRRAAGTQPGQRPVLGPCLGSETSAEFMATPPEAERTAWADEAERDIRRLLAGQKVLSTEWMNPMATLKSINPTYGARRGGRGSFW